MALTKIQKKEKEIFDTVYMWGRAIKVNHNAPTYKKLMREYRQLILANADEMKRRDSRVQRFEDTGKHWGTVLRRQGRKIVKVVKKIKDDCNCDK